MKDTRKLSTLHGWKDNPRNITTKDYERLKLQIQKLGQYKPILITKDGEVIGGNMRIKAYQELGITDVWVSEVDPKDENEKLEYALSDNDRAGYYDDDMIANLIPNYDIDWSQYAVDMKPPEDIQKLIDRIAPVEEDEAPEVSEGEPVSKLGEVYQLGRHRLMCGDSTDTGSVAMLMNGQKADCLYTDPPYGMSLDTNYDDMFKGDKTHKNKGDRFEKVIADDNYFDPSFLFVILPDIKEMFLWGADYFYNSLPRGGSWSAWDKRSEKLDDVIGNTTEFLWSKQPHRRMTARVLWSGHHGMGKDDDKKRLHPTQKPVGLHKWFFENYGNGINSVVDLFGGSGSTLIACEQTNRICYMMELDPKYCDVIRKRYAKFIGKEAEWQTITPIIK